MASNTAKPSFYGHLHVHQRNVLGLACDDFQRFQSDAGQIGPVTHLFHQPHHKLLGHQIVFGDQNAQQPLARTSVCLPAGGLAAICGITAPLTVNLAPLPKRFNRNWHRRMRSVLIVPEA